MSNLKLSIFKKIAAYEFDYLSRKFRLVQALIFVLFLLVLIIISLSDAQSFFLDENSPIPDSWRILKNETVARFLSVLVISASYFLPWLSEVIRNRKDTSELSTAIEESLIPAIEIELKELRATIKRKFGLSKCIRISIFIPIRKGVCQWFFKMVCKTSNIPERELEAQFSLDEGVIGYTFLKNRRHCIEFVNIAEPPRSYRHLTAENATLINSDIRFVLVVSAFQEGSVSGLLAIDTDNDEDIIRMQDQPVHDIALDWIMARSKAIKLLWRIKNNV